MRLYVARHGETLWNAQNKVCGRTDLSLTERGHAQAEKLAEEAKQCNLDLIISSPMKRALETAGAVARACNIPISVDDRLIEQDYGIYEGVDRQDSGFLANKRQFACKYPGGESMMQVAHRVYNLLEELKEAYPEKNVLLVCHGGVCRIIRTYFEDMTNEEFFCYSEQNATLKEYTL
ncbi:MAG: histidine phosphatase family protein [Anaerotignum sp.]|nr:histidine phosphatase family protein [Anaerotignum sp.]